jgi:hypothetical protein
MNPKTETSVDNSNAEPLEQNPSNAQPLSTQPARPVQNTPPIEPAAQQRPVAPWPPAGTPAATEMNSQNTVVKTAPSAQELQAIGTEVSESAGAIQPTSTPKNTKISDFKTSPSVPNPPINPTVVPPEPLMSDNQADQLFTEDSKPKKSKSKLKKVVVTLLVLVLSLALTAAAYIFLYGSQQAQSYKNSSPFTSYQEAFTQIKLSLEKTPIDSAEFEAGSNKLKSAVENPGKLTNIYLGDLNPNYKKAKNAKSIEIEYQKQAEQYLAAFGTYPEFLSSLSESFNLVSQIEDFSSLDLTTKTAEDVSTEMTKFVEDCNETTKEIEAAEKPAEVSAGSKKLKESLSNLCSGDSGSIKNGPLVVLAGKSGALSTEDQTALKDQLSSISSLATSLTSGEDESAFDINSLIAYQRSSLENTQKLLEQVEAILNR